MVDCNDYENECEAIGCLFFWLWLDMGRCLDGEQGLMVVLSLSMCIGVTSYTTLVTSDREKRVFACVAVAGSTRICNMLYSQK